MLKILYIVKSGRLYGDNKALLGIIDGLDRDVVRPIFIVSENGPLLDELEKRSIEYHRVKFSFSVYPKFDKSIKNLFLFIPRLVKGIILENFALGKVSQIVKNLNPDIIHTNVGPIYLGFRISRRFDIPHIWHLREYQDLDFNMFALPSKKYFKRMVHNSNVVAITKGVYNYFDLDNCNKLSKVIYDGVLPAESILPPYRELRDSFLFVGRIEEAKGIDILVDAIINIKRKIGLCVKLKIAGEGAPGYVNSLQQKIRAAGLEDFVEFLGYRRDVGTIMNQSLALVVPSRYEGFGFITVEAMFNSCLVIGKNSGGTKEILSENSLGLLFDNTDDLEIQLIEIYSHNRNKYADIVKRAQDEAVSKYSTERNRTEILNFYKIIINEKS